MPYRYKPVPMFRTGRYLGARRIQRAFRKYKKKKNSTSSIVRSNRRKINKLLNSEVTFKDTIYNANISSSGLFLQVGLQTIAQGDEEGERQGDKVTIKSLSFRGCISVINGTVVNADGFNNVRMIVVKIPQPNTNSPLLVTDILQVQNYKSHYKKKSDVKFKILLDKTYYMDNQGFGTGASSDPKWQPVKSHQATCNFKLTFPKGLDVTYQAGTSVVFQNDIRVFLLSDSAAPGHPVITGYLRNTFLP